MKNKTNTKHYSAIALLVIIMLFFAVQVSALTVDVNGSAGVGVGKSNNSASATGTIKMESGERNSSSTNSQATSSTKVNTSSNKGGVSAVVQALLSVANRDGGIGTDVRLVAQEQASSSEKVKSDMDKVSAESKVKVFLFGPSYKTLGQLRSSIVTTNNHISRLRNAQEKTTDASVKADLEVQIKALQESSVNTQLFIDANEDRLSILGWFIKIFVN